MNRINLRGSFWLILILSFSLFAQETHNLEIIWQKTGDTTFLSYGALPTTSGDVNGDGYYDILYYGNELSWAGRAYLFYGGSNIDTIPDAIFSNSNGYDAVCMGDFNGDNFDDIALGNQNGPDGYGRVFIYLGGNPIDTICDFQMRGPHSGSLFGQALSSGDVNGDSYNDLIVGAYMAAPMPGGYGMGQVYIYYGGSHFDTIPDVLLNGGHNNDQEGLGYSVSGEGDANNDGFSDLIIGAVNFGTGYQGRIYIYFGGNPIDTSYDVAMIGEGPNQYLGLYGVDFLSNDFNYDHAIFGCRFWPYGFPRTGPGKVYVLYGGNPMDSIPDVWMIGKTDTSGLGNWTANAGDVNTDNCDDIISGAPIEYSEKGSAYLWLGGALLDTTPDAWLRGVQPFDGIGWMVASAGDVDGDGRDEMMVSNYATPVLPHRVWVCQYTGPGIGEERLTQNAERLTLEIYPNPAKGVIRIRGPLSERNIKIFDISGKMIKEIASATKLPRNDRVGEVKISLKGINPGIYFLRLGKETKKFLVVR